jgi:hypothetical protein
LPGRIRDFRDFTQDSYHAGGDDGKIDMGPGNDSATIARWPLGTHLMTIIAGPRSLFGGVLLIGSMFLPCAAQRALAEPRPAPKSELAPRDWLLTNKARKALQKDEQLKPLNIGVSVKDRVATIWGSIPSTEAGKRAEEALKQVDGIVAVMNECRIVPIDDLPQAVADAVKIGRINPEAPPPSAQLTTWPPAPTATANRMTAKPSPEEMAPRPNGDVNEVRPGAPLLPPPPAVVLLAPIVVESPKDLQEWEIARQSEPRFKATTLEMRSGVVTINGSVKRMKDAWDLADKLNALACVTQVIMGNVSEN